MSNMVAIDVGFASMGVVVLCIRAHAYDLVYKEVISTKPSPKKLNIRSADDNIRRCREITRSVRRILDEYDAEVVVLEMPSMGSKSAKAMRAMGLASGIIATLDVVYGDIPFLYATPSNVKVAMTGNKTASKEEVQVIAEEKIPGILEGVNKTQREHIADALGAAVAVEDDPVIRILRSKAHDA